MCPSRKRRGGKLGLSVCQTDSAKHRCAIIDGVTMPVGVPDPDETVAVNVTDCPEFEGFNDGATEVEVAVRLWLPQEENLNEPMRVFQSLD